MKTLDNLFDDYEAELAEAARKQIAAEDAAWAALTPEQQQAHFDAVAARMEAQAAMTRDDYGYDDISDEDDSDEDNED